MWKKAKENKIKTMIITIVVVIIAWMLYLRIFEDRPWIKTGIRAYTDWAEVQHPEKTLWDWMELFIIPAVLGLGALVFTNQQRVNDQKIEYNRNQEATLQNYMDEMTELLIDQDLQTVISDNGSPVSNVAKVRTVTALRILDEERRNIILRFLYMSRLSGNILEYTNLSEVDLTGAVLIEFNLKFTNLCEANLHKAKLDSANLFRAHLNGANLCKADLTRAKMQYAILDFANLSNATLIHADLTKSMFRETNLTDTKFGNTNLYEAYITRTKITDVQQKGINNVCPW
jgi:uncharacterized protein YjbI with pentapeptide repeats